MAKIIIETAKIGDTLWVTLRSPSSSTNIWMTPQQAADLAVDLQEKFRHKEGI
jgi:hypothetical protein